jgi:hypothetical protein
MDEIREAERKRFEIIKETDSFKRFDGTVEFLKMVGKLNGEQYPLSSAEIERRRLETMNYLFQFLPGDVSKIDLSKMSPVNLPLVAERQVEGEGKEWGFEEFTAYWVSLEEEISATMLSLKENR